MEALSAADVEQLFSAFDRPCPSRRRGYAIVQTGKDGAVVSDASQVSTGDGLNITLNHGVLEADVSSVREGE